MPRPLSPDEKRVILCMLGPEVEGGAALRAQVDSGLVLRHWIDGFPSIDIGVAETCAASSYPVKASPLTRRVVDEHGDAIGVVQLWIEAGKLSALEYAWFTDDAPTELPPSERIVR